jgi:lambda repressor-like predicted transcriptional regulator
MVYDNIKAICDKKGISIKKLEQEAELGSGTIYKWQTVSPTLENLKIVADKLGVKVSKLID